MRDHEHDFLIAEFEQAWAMILNIDERRFKFVEYYSAIFTAVLVVGTSLVTWHGEIDATVAAPLTVLLVVGVLIGFTFESMIKSERKANVRYRKKINLIRSILLDGTADPLFIRYLTEYGELGVKNLEHSDQPSGTGSTLSGVLLFLRIEVAVMMLAIAAMWVAVLVRA